MTNESDTKYSFEIQTIYLLSEILNELKKMNKNNEKKMDENCFHFIDCRSGKNSSIHFNDISDICSSTSETIPGLFVHRSHFINTKTKTSHSVESSERRRFLNWLFIQEQLKKEKR